MIKPIKQLRYALRLSTTFLKTHRRLIVFGAAGSILFALFTPKVAQILNQRPAIKKVGTVGKHTIDTLPREILGVISYGLTSIKADGSFAPELAKNWEISNDATEYTFYLKSGYMWHDKTPLLGSQLTYNFTDVSILHPDPMTLVFRLKEPFAPFPGVISWPVFKKGLTGLGEKRVTSIKRNGKVIEELTLYSPSNHQKTIYRFYPSPQAAITAFKLGEIDELRGITGLEEIQMWPNVSTGSSINQSKLVVLLFNLDFSLFQERNMRQAIAYGIKKDWPSRAYGPISPDSWAYNPTLKTYDYNLNKAQELLANATQEDQDLSLKLTTFPSLYPTAEKIARDLEEMGIKIEIHTTDYVPSEFELLLIIQEIPPDPDQYALWHSTQPGNLTRLKSPQIDKLLEDGRQTVDFEARKDIYFDFQRFLVEETPAVFLYHPQSYTLTRK